MNVEALDLLATSVFLVNARGHIEYANAAAEDLFGRSRKQLCGHSAATLFDNPENIQSSIDRAAAGRYADVRQLASLRRAAESVEVAVTTVGLSGQAWPVLIETREIEQRVLADRNHRLVDEIEAHRELLRNLAHEVKNPLGGLRGAAERGAGRVHPGHHFRSRPPAGAGGPPERPATCAAERAAGEHP